MNDLGLFALGLSTGMIAASFLSTHRTERNIFPSLVALLPALLAGGAIIFHPTLVHASSSDFYPVGLVVAFLWQKTAAMLDNVDTSPRIKQALTVAGFAATLVLTVAAIVLAYQI